MIKLIKSKMRLRADFNNFIEYEKCVSDLIQDENVRSMENYIQHSNITCLEHSVYVSYTSYLVCRFLGLDYVSAARAGLLHDFFLYDWHKKSSKSGFHGFTHPNTALENANKFFALNDLEKDIIVKHMWPLTVKLPKYKESFIVVFIDKYRASMEIIKLGNRTNIHRLISELY